GNYFNQELFGRPTEVPWALEVDVAYRPLRYAESPTFHPTFAYESLWNLGLAGLIVWGGTKVVLRPGRWFPVYLVGYGVGRFWVELMRSDTASQLLGLRVNTWVSGLILLGGLVWLFWGGSPVDREATAELRAGGNPRQFAAGPGTVPGGKDTPAPEAVDTPAPVADPGPESSAGPGRPTDSQPAPGRDVDAQE
ncbi:MAG: prolipoprotein diacylglyceryl transferase family protein, partial [Actinomycetes bacterium]